VVSIVEKVRRDFGGCVIVRQKKSGRPMITPKQLRDLLTAAPFKPFRICLSDGTGYDITNHDMALVERNTLDIGVNPDPDGIAERLVRCAFIHIVKIEDLQHA
jgi:hypothetical protein